MHLARKEYFIPITNICKLLNQVQYTEILNDDTAECYFNRVMSLRRYLSNDID